MNSPDIERTQTAIRWDAEDRLGSNPPPLVGADVVAYREVMRRVAEQVEQRAAEIDANLIAVEVLAEAGDAAHGEWDPYVHIGSAAVGVIRALREIGWSKL